MNRFYIYMIFTKSLFSNYQCFFVKFFGLIVFSQAVVHQYQVVITYCSVGMIFNKNRSANRQYFFVKFFGLIVFSQVVVH